MIVIGGPSGWIGDRDGPRGREVFSGVPIQERSWWRPPGFPALREASGETVQSRSEDWAFYFQHVRKWQYYFIKASQDSWPTAEDFCQWACQECKAVQVYLEPLATNRQEEPIAFSFHLIVARYRRAQVGNRIQSALEPFKEASPLFVLPAPSEVDHAAAVELILEERYKIPIRRSQPAWIHDYLLPHQLQLQQAIIGTREKIRELEQFENQKQGELLDSLRLQRVLFSSGPELEALVRELLEILGVDIEDSPTKNRDDGRFTAPGSNQVVMLEIKGRGKSMKLEDIRQLAGWIKTARNEEALDVGKGLFIGCGFTADAPNARAGIFPDNAIKAAELEGFALMTSTQVLTAAHEVQAGRLKIEQFWARLLSTRGLYK